MPLLAPDVTCFSHPHPFASAPFPPWQAEPAPPVEEPVDEDWEVSDKTPGSDAEIAATAAKEAAEKEAADAAAALAAGPGYTLDANGRKLYSRDYMLSLAERWVVPMEVPLEATRFSEIMTTREDNVTPEPHQNYRCLIGARGGGAGAAGGRGGGAPSGRAGGSSIFGSGAQSAGPGSRGQDGGLDSWGAERRGPAGGGGGGFDQRGGGPMGAPRPGGPGAPPNRGGPARECDSLVRLLCF